MKIPLECYSHTNFVLSSAWQPAADIYRCKNSWLLKIDLAGVAKKDICLSSKGHRLTLTGTRRDTVIATNHVIHSMEIAYHQFERVFEFAFDLDDALITTKYQDGMLHINIQKEG